MAKVENDVQTDVSTEAVALLRRVAALGGRGHKYRPVAEKDRAIIEAANRSEPSQPSMSLDCWDCPEYADKRWSDTMTFADHWHEEYEAMSAVRAFLDRI